jgi:CotH kinase protein
MELASGDPADTGTAVEPEPGVEEVPGVPEESTWRPALVLNEVQSSNRSTPLDVPGEFPDWIELYNDSQIDVDLATVELRQEDDEGWIGSGMLAPGERLVLTADDLGFGLDQDGERLELLVDDLVVDRLATGWLEGDTAWARFPDGGTWAVTTRPTPGWTNGSRASDTTDPSDELFGVRRVHQVELTISEANLDILRDSPYTEVPASLSMKGAWFSQVGVRLKGVWGSLRTPDQKCSFKVDLNAYDDHRMYGQETLTLNNVVQDPTYVAESLTYALFREADVPAPRTTWARVSVNGEHFGLYSVVETVDDTFLRRWWADGSGRMWEGAYGVDLTSSYIASFEFDEGADDDRTVLEEIAAILDDGTTDDHLEALEHLVDMDEFLSNMAVEAVSLHWDGYTTANNYRLYEDPVSGRISIIPWGVDQTWQDYYYGPYNGYGNLLEACVANATCLARYKARLVEVADLADGLDLETTMDENLELIADELLDDPRAEITTAEHDAYVAIMRNAILTVPGNVRNGASAR